MVCLAGCLYASPQAKPPAPPTEQEPPEEDESLKPKEYTLNPVQSARELTAGNFYFKKGNYRAAPEDIWKQPAGTPVRPKRSCV